LNLVVDLAKLDELSRQKWADNWNFREFLIQKVAPDLIDRTAQQLNAEVAGAIDCTACGHCCRASKPSLPPEAIARLAAAKAMTTEKFTQLYTAPEADGVLSFCQTPCPMLKGNLCSVYAARPDDCRSYPHLQHPDFLAGSVATIENYRVCPIVFNVYEKMKAALRYDPNIDYIGDRIIEE